MGFSIYHNLLLLILPSGNNKDEGSPIGGDNIAEQRLNEFDVCTETSGESKQFEDVKLVDIILFSTVAVLWAINLAFLLCKQRMHNTLITGLLYGIIGLITITRLTEVIKLQMYSTSKMIVVTGILATYSKIALGCCQLTAMFTIRTHMKGHIRTFRHQMGLEED